MQDALEGESEGRSQDNTLPVVVIDGVMDSVVVVGGVMDSVVVIDGVMDSVGGIGGEMDSVGGIVSVVVVDADVMD